MQITTRIRANQESADLLAASAAVLSSPAVAELSAKQQIALNRELAKICEVELETLEQLAFDVEMTGVEVGDKVSIRCLNGVVGIHPAVSVSKETGSKLDQILSKLSQAVT